MRIDIISVKPELLTGPFDHSIIARAKDKGLLEIYVHNLRDYGTGKHKVIDDYQYGGGAGMVMMCGPLDNIIACHQRNIYRRLCTVRWRVSGCGISR